MDYVVVIEKADDNSYSAYIPDLPGCVACGETQDEVRLSIQQAVDLHIESLRAHNEPVPKPSTTVYAVHAG